MQYLLFLHLGWYTISIAISYISLYLPTHLTWVHYITFISSSNVFFLFIYICNNPFKISTQLHKKKTVVYTYCLPNITIIHQLIISNIVIHDETKCSAISKSIIIVFIISEHKHNRRKQFIYVWMDECPSSFWICI